MGTHVINTEEYRYSEGQIVDLFYIWNPISILEILEGISPDSKCTEDDTSKTMSTLCVVRGVWSTITQSNS